MICYGTSCIAMFIACATHFSLSFPATTLRSSQESFSLVSCGYVFLSKEFRKLVDTFIVCFVSFLSLCLSMASNSTWLIRVNKKRLIRVVIRN